MRKLAAVLIFGLFFFLASVKIWPKLSLAASCDTTSPNDYFHACGYDADETDPSNQGLWAYRNDYNEAFPSTSGDTTTAFSYQIGDCESGGSDGHGYSCNYGKIWRGRIYFSEGLYKFHTLTDDGVKLFIDNAGYPTGAIIDNWDIHSPTDDYALYYVTEGYHDIRLEFFQGGGWAYAVLDWTKQTCDESYKTDGFHVCSYTAPTPNNQDTWIYRGDYDESAPTTSGNTTTAYSYQLPGYADDGHGNTTNYGKVWRGQIYCSEGGYYTFHTQTDDGFRVFLDESNILEDWSYHSPTDRTTDLIYVSAGYHNIRMEFFQGIDQHYSVLDWTFIPCPYTSLQPRFRVNINGTWQGWTDTLNINQWQMDGVQAAVFYDGTGNLADLPNKVQLVFAGYNLSSNPADIGALIPGVGNFAVAATGIGVCGTLPTTAASLNVLYCPYKNITVNSNRGRSSDPWLPDITINKKDSKSGKVASGVYYNNDDGSGNLWTTINNLNFTLTKPSGENLPFDVNPKTFPKPPSWYSPGLYLNYPGGYSLAATGTNNGASCGDYPPRSSGTINMINCSYDSTTAGFQEVAEPPKAWSADLYEPFSGVTVKSGGFHDRTLSSIDPNTTDIEVYTPAEQVILKILGPGGFDQRADQGAPFTYTATGDYTLYVNTPDVDTADTSDIEDGPGCSASAALHVGADRPISSCVETENKINCCPFTLSSESLWDGLVNAIGFLLASNPVAPFKMGVDVDKVEFSADRAAHSNLLFGKVTNEGGSEKFETGSLFLLSPPGSLDSLGLDTSGQNPAANITKRRERVSWEVGLENGTQPLKKGDVSDIGPVALAGEQIQKYLTRLPGVGEETAGLRFNPKGSALSPQTQSFSFKATLASAKPVAQNLPSRTASTPEPSHTGQILGTTSDSSCQEKLPRPNKEVECYGTTPGYSSTGNLSDILEILDGSDSLTAKVSEIDVASRTLVGDVTVCDTDGRGCTDTKISQNSGAFDLFKLPSGKGYKNISADGKSSPIRFTIEIGTPAGFPEGTSPLILALWAIYGIPTTGSGTVPASSFDPDLKDCSIVYTGQGSYPEIGTPKLSCVYLISNPELKMRYFGSIQSALYNSDLTSAEPGLQCKLDIPGGSVCANQASIVPVVTPPPSFTGSCKVCNFNRGGPGRALEDLLDEVAGAVGTPASVLAGMLNFEGYEPANPVRHIFNNTDEQIISISTPGQTDPYCATSYVGAQGPCQFMPSQWAAYGSTVNNYGYNHTPNICNLRDCLYAAGAKLRDDAGRLGSACGYDNLTPPPSGSCQWTGANSAKGAYHYYGACTDNYVSTVVNYYYNYTCQE